MNGRPEVLLLRTNGHGNVAARNHETALCHARFPSLLALSPEGREGGSLCEFHANSETVRAVSSRNFFVLPAREGKWHKPQT